MWMLSHFLRVKQPTVWEEKRTVQSKTKAGPGGLSTSRIQDLSYCSDAFGSAVKVQIEMLKLVTEKKKNTHM